MGFVDHGPGGTGEPVAALLRPGNAAEEVPARAQEDPDSHRLRGRHPRLRRTARPARTVGVLFSRHDGHRAGPPARAEGSGIGLDAGRRDRRRDPRRRAWVLSRVGEIEGASVRTSRTWLLRVRGPLAWSERREAPPAWHRRTQCGRPTVPIPQSERLRPLPQDELPRICQKPTITVRPVASASSTNSARIGTTFTPPGRTPTGPSERTSKDSTEGPAKSHGIDISDPTKRLAHWRVAQTILLTLMICSVNLHILFSWDQTTRTQTTGTFHGVTAFAGSASTPPAAAGLPPPTGPEIREII